LKRASAIVVAALLGACSPEKGEQVEPEKAHQKAPTKVSSVLKVATVPGFEGYPTAQPDGSPLNADYCLRIGDTPTSPFDNIKTCVMIACETGDAKSCQLAESYNGNISQAIEADEPS
jgi:hypothetical protein